MRVFLLCNSSSSSLSPPPPTTTHHRPQKPLLIPPKNPSLISSLTGAALSFNLLFFSPLSPLPPPSIASDFTPSQSECREEDQRREEVRRFESAPELVTNEEIVKEAWQIVDDGFLGSDRNRWSPQSWLVCIHFFHKPLKASAPPFWKKWSTQGFQAIIVLQQLPKTIFKIKKVGRGIVFLQIYPKIF